MTGFSTTHLGSVASAAAGVGHALYAAGLALGVAWLVLALVWSDFGEGAGYAAPLAVLAAAASVLAGRGLRRLLARA